MSVYIPAKSADLTNVAPLKSRVYTDPLIDQRICTDTLVQFLEKYLQGNIASYKFAYQFDQFYRLRIDYENLNNDETTIIKKLVITADNYAPDHINPKRVYSTEEELKDSAQKAFDYVKNNAYLATIKSKY